MLRRTANVALVGALLLLPLTALAQEKAAGGPKLDVPEKIQDLGVVPQGKTVDTVFKLVNEGTATLEVRAVRPTCGCTVAHFDRKIEPGKTGQVKATLDTTNFIGPITKSMLVMTNDPVEPTTTLIIKAIVQPYLEVLPRPLVRFNAIKGEQVSREVTVVAENDQEFHVTKVDANVPYLTATVRRLEGDELIQGKSKAQYAVAVMLGEDAEPGPVNAVVTIHTDHPKAPEVKVRVFGVIRQLIHVSPREIQFGTVDPKVKPGRNVIVVNNTQGPVKVTGVAVDDPAFAAESASIEDGKRYQVTVTIKPEAESGQHSATLVISTTDEQFSKIDVPVHANIK